MNEDVHVRIDKDVMRRVRRYAKSYGISLAAAVTVLLVHGLDREYRAKSEGSHEPGNQSHFAAALGTSKRRRNHEH